MKSGSLSLPKAITTAPAEDARELGLLTPGFAEGSILLKNKAGEYFRLAWHEPQRGQDRDKERRRALPPGEYTLTGYWVVRHDDKGSTWYLSATGRDIRRVVVRAGESQRVPVGETVHMQCRARAVRDGAEIQMTIAGQHHTGLSIYREGKRLSIRYRVADAGDRELATGVMEYG